MSREISLLIEAANKNRKDRQYLAVKQAANELLGIDGSGSNKFKTAQEASAALTARAEKILEEQRHSTT